MPQPALAQRFLDCLTGEATYASLRHMRTSTEVQRIRRGVCLSPTLGEEQGYMITVHANGGAGYAASPDDSPAGLRQAYASALAWAKQARQHAVHAFTRPERPVAKGHYESPGDQTSFAMRQEYLGAVATHLQLGNDIVDTDAMLSTSHTDTLFLDSEGSYVTQSTSLLIPLLSVVAHHEGVTEQRSFGGLESVTLQGGLELWQGLHLEETAKRLPDEARELVRAPLCPNDTMDLLLAPDQLWIQIHESIGHPLELDRILGDERNYAGTSFVTPAMFGSYQYGSSLLNIVFEPGLRHEAASYAFDDEGMAAERAYLIKDGILLRGLGGHLSQTRAGLPGVASTRATSWNRPPIDRMANVNMESGHSSFDAMVAAVENGIYMESNVSWSIDDSRNKFQFGCERGRLIRNGRLAGVVRKPNYRGSSAVFWRQLAMVGDKASYRVLGTPYCGKGEPNQVITVGHATPAALFKNVEVFGG